MHTSLATHTKRGNGPQTLAFRAALTDDQRTGSPSNACTCMDLFGLHRSCRSASTWTIASTWLLATPQSIRAIADPLELRLLGADSDTQTPAHRVLGDGLPEQPFNCRWMSALRSGSSAVAKTLMTARRTTPLPSRPVLGCGPVGHTVGSIGSSP